MITRPVLRPKHITLAQQVKYLGCVCLFVPIFVGANPEVPQLQEAAPPWIGQPLPADVPPDSLESQEAATVNTTVTPSSITDNTSAVEHPVTDTTSSVESWYRNRRQVSNATPSDLVALEAAANNGDIQAQYQLALEYRGAHNPNPDLVKSLQWQQKAAQNGHAEAQYGLGNLYANGQYVVADQSLARHWFNRAAQQGHVAAKLALLSLDNGNPSQMLAASTSEPQAAPLQPSESTSERIELASAVPNESPVMLSAQTSLNPDDNGHAGSVGDKGASAGNDLSGIDPSLIKQSAESGDKQAQLILGTLYEDGVGGFSVDLREAAYWYEQAAKQDYPKAQYNLGLLYEDGRGVKQSDQQAAYWYERAAQAGFAEAQNNLGVLYILGKGVKKDPKRAEQLFAASAAQGNTDAQRNLDILRQKR